MAEEIIIPEGVSKTEKYEALLPQLKSLIESEPDVIANMANISAALKEVFGFFWVGFYIVKDDQLVLGPFQGPIACTRIRCGKGVCGTAWKEQKPIIVPDVDEFPGHIACSSLSKSEIVIPVFRQEKVVAVLDVDSEFLDHFDGTDEKYLSEIVKLVKF
ncbi:GAF domain-containing protein [Petrimonas sp.]|uniref:GAF domain-containing protein n=1 Tax=Petrimonas sp. TaxID=2023866 RepID=UPI003F5180CF